MLSAPDSGEVWFTGFAQIRLVGRVTQIVLVAFEHRGQFCYPEEFLPALIQMDEFQRVVVPLGGQIKANDRAQAGTIQVAYIGVVQHNTVVLRDESAYGRLE